MDLLDHETPQFSNPDQWPQNSPDLNLVDYRVRGIMQERVKEHHLLWISLPFALFQHRNIHEWTLCDPGNTGCG